MDCSQDVVNLGSINSCRLCLERIEYLAAKGGLEEISDMEATILADNKGGQNIRLFTASFDGQ